MAPQLDPKIKKEKDKKMIKQDQENLPSITTRKNDAAGERGSVIKEMDTAVFAREVDGMMDLTRIEKGELNKIDLESMMDKTEKMVLKKKKDVKVKKNASYLRRKRKKLGRATEKIMIKQLKGWICM